MLGNRWNGCTSNVSSQAKVNQWVLPWQLPKTSSNKWDGCELSNLSFGASCYANSCPGEKYILHETMLGKGKPTLEREIIQYNNGDKLVIHPSCLSGKHMEFALQWFDDMLLSQPISGLPCPFSNMQSFPQQKHFTITVSGIIVVGKFHVLNHQ